MELCTPNIVVSFPDYSRVMLKILVVVVSNQYLYWVETEYFTTTIVKHLLTRVGAYLE